jgi:dTDP-4-dehydrorhamnose reductase
MRVLLTGAHGQLGRHLAERCPEHVELIATDRDLEATARQQPCDLTDRAAVLDLLDAVQPDCILNPAAWTAVDAAEDHEAEAAVLNRDLPTWLAEWTQARNAGLISYSTDYVFDGQPGRGWVETDDCSPQSAYGRTKRAGEEAVLAIGGRNLILRTAWLYSALPGNFLTAILNRAVQGQDLRVVSDQIGSPTWAGTLAQATWALLEPLERLDGPSVMHVAGKGAMSWHAFAEMAVRSAQQSGQVPESVRVDPIASDEWPQKAQRPAWSVLDCSYFERVSGMMLPSVDDALQECLQQWLKQQAQ